MSHCLFPRLRVPHPKLHPDHLSLSWFTPIPPLRQLQWPLNLASLPLAFPLEIHPGARLAFLEPFSPSPLTPAAVQSPLSHLAIAEALQLVSLTCPYPLLVHSSHWTQVMFFSCMCGHIPPNSPWHLKCRLTAVTCKASMDECPFPLCHLWPPASLAPIFQPHQPFFQPLELSKIIFSLEPSHKHGRFISRSFTWPSPTSPSVLRSLSQRARL